MANAFGTSVGSRTLKLWSAVVIAAIFEFLGAMLLGGQVTKTIAGGIAKTSTFTSNPYVFMFGKCSILLMTSLLNSVADLPVPGSSGWLSHFGSYCCMMPHLLLLGDVVSFVS